MENQTEPAEGFRGLVRWAMTPPQSVAVYFVVLVLVLGMSFYAGTLNPKKPVGWPAADLRAAQLTDVMPGSRESDRTTR